jgi:hypothetical protein
VCNPTTLGHLELSSQNSKIDENSHTELKLLEKSDPDKIKANSNNSKLNALSGMPLFRW